MIAGATPPYPFPRVSRLRDNCVAFVALMLVPLALDLSWTEFTDRPFPDSLVAIVLVFAATCFAGINFRHGVALSLGRRVLAAIVVTAALLVPWSLASVMFTYVVRMSVGLPE